jgi:hypothetical protein
LFASPGQTVDPATLTLDNDTRSLDERIAAIEKMNPTLNGKPINEFTPIFIPGPNDDIQMCKGNFSSITAEYKALPLDAKQSIDDIGADEALTLLQAIQQFKYDYLPNYGLGDAAPDTNTFAGGIVGAQAARSVAVISQMKYIERLLKQYQTVKGTERAALKPLIKEAYKTLNEEFGTVLSKYIARSGSKGPLISARQGMKSALKGRTVITNSARARPLISAAKGFKYVSKGLVLLDIGFRINNVAHSNNMGLTMTSELFGFGASYYTAVIGGTLAASLALGPLGWIIAIIVIGATVVLADYIGKSVGSYLYNQGASIYNGATMTLAY